jgi:hypothetical protein
MVRIQGERERANQQETEERQKQSKEMSPVERTEKVMDKLDVPRAVSFL